MEPPSDPLADRITAEDAKRLYQYWLTRRSGRQFPSRKEIDPLVLGFVLGRISLVEVSNDPRRFLYALVSAELTEHLGYEMTDKYVDEMPEPGVRDYVTALYTRALDARTPLYEEGAAILDKRVWRYKTLVLPLSSDGEAIDMLLVYRDASNRPKA
jgi:hypothetical protein